jgi:hypothetical protein
VARELGLPLIDKDDILESLFETRGTGDVHWRRFLSRESDELFVRQALNSGGAVLCSFWHQAGMPADSGTPTAWLGDLPGPVIHVRCCCDPLVAAQRFLARNRHSGHLDHMKQQADVTRDFVALAQLGALDIQPRLDVDTEMQLDIARLVRHIRDAWRLTTRAQVSP